VEDLSGLGDDFNGVSPDPADEASARARLRWAISGEKRHWLGGVWVALSAMVVVLAAVGAVALRPLPVEPPVASLLEVADTVAALPPTPLSGDGYYLTRSERLVLTTVRAEEPVVSFIQPSQREVWVAADGTTRVLTTYGAPRFLTAEDQSAFELSGLAPNHESGETVVQTYGPAEFVADPAVWPSDAPRLQQALLERLGPGDQQPHALRLLQSAVELIRENGPDPSLRAAVLRVIAGVPGIQVSGTTELVTVVFDGALPERTERRVYTFDASTGHLVSESVTVVSADHPRRTVFSSRYEPPVQVKGDPGRS
jgi:hypothetical protein